MLAAKRKKINSHENRELQLWCGLKTSPELPIVEFIMINNAPSNDRTEHVIRWLHGVLGGDVCSPDMILTGLAQAFAAKGAGLAALIGDKAMLVCNGGQEAVASCAPPWESRPTFLAELQASPRPLFQRCEDAAFLAKLVCDPNQAQWLVWIDDVPGRIWTPAENAAFGLAAQAIPQALADANSQAWAMIASCAELKRHLADAVKVTGRLSHDFSNMLTAILGFAELCLAQIPRDGLPARFVREVWQSANDAAQWVRKLQMFARDIRSNHPATNLAAVAASEQARLRNLWGDEVALVTDIPEHLPPLAIDAESLRCVLDQLLQNGREAIKLTGVVSLTARETTLAVDECLQMIGAVRPGRHIEITISDTGIGMTEEVRRRLLHDVFFSTKGRHRGLGLPIVFGMLRSFQGGFSVAPASQRGAAVKVWLPIAENLKPASATRTRSERNALAGDALVSN